MTEEEIKTEAARRVAAMSKDEMMSFLKFSETNRQLVQKAWDPLTVLSDPEKKQLHRLWNIALCRKNIEDSAFLRRLDEQFHLTVEDIRNGAKNPITLFVSKAILSALLWIAVGAVFCFLGEHFGIRLLTLGGIALGGRFVISLLYRVAALSAIPKYRNLQKRVQSGAWDEAEVEAEMAVLMIKELQLH